MTQSPVAFFFVQQLRQKFVQSVLSPIPTATGDAADDYSWYAFSGKKGDHLVMRGPMIQDTAPVAEQKPIEVEPFLVDYDNLMRSSYVAIKGTRITRIVFHTFSPAAHNLWTTQLQRRWVCSLALNQTAQLCLNLSCLDCSISELGFVVAPPKRPVWRSVFHPLNPNNTRYDTYLSEALHVLDKKAEFSKRPVVYTENPGKIPRTARSFAWISKTASRLARANFLSRTSSRRVDRRIPTKYWLGGVGIKTPTPAGSLSATRIKD